MNKKNRKKSVCSNFLIMTKKLRQNIFTSNSSFLLKEQREVCYFYFFCTETRLHTKKMSNNEEKDELSIVIDTTDNTQENDTTINELRLEILRLKNINNRLKEQRSLYKQEKESFERENKDLITKLSYHCFIIIVLVILILFLVATR